MVNKNPKTPELNEHLFRVRDGILTVPVDLPLIKASLIKLLVFLSSPEGRTDENCSTADAFFCLHDDYGFNWNHLPEEYQLIFEDIGGKLHETLEHPGTASNFESTPEQLLERVFSLSE